MAPFSSRAQAALFLLLSGLATLASADATIESEVELREKAGMFTMFVPPDYPKEVLAQGRSAAVDVFGTVQPDGTLVVDRVERAQGDEPFEREVRDVARFWMLRPAFDKECDPKPAKAQVRVWFEVRDGSPVISFTQGKWPAKADKAKADGPKIKWSRRPKIEYPSTAARSEREGMLEVLVRIEPDGTVDKLTYVPGPLVNVFGEAIRKGFRRALFEPLPAEYKGAVCGSYEIEFRLTNIPSR